MDSYTQFMLHRWNGADACVCARLLVCTPNQPTSQPANKTAADSSTGTHHDVEVRVLLRVFAGTDLAAELVDVCQRLQLAVDEGVGFGEQLILQAHASYTTALQLLDEAASVVEVPVASIAVQENGDVRVLRHELNHLQNLRP